MRTRKYNATHQYIRTLSVNFEIVFILDALSGWRSWLHVWLLWKVVGSSHIKGPVVSLSNKLYPYCLVLVGSRNGFEREFTIELKYIEGFMEDWLKCQISPLVKYQHQHFNIVLFQNYVFPRGVKKYMCYFQLYKPYTAVRCEFTK